MKFVDMGIPFTLSGITLLGGLVWFWQRSRQWRRYIRIPIICILSVVTVFLFVTGSVLFWYTHRPIPSDFQKELYTGVMYYRDVRSEPRPVIIHVITIDLTQANVQFVVTAGDLDADRPFRAQTTSDFLKKNGVQIAINGDFFEPWWNDGPWDYYPHTGDRVNVFGLASSEGMIYERGQQHFQSFYMSEDQVPSFEPPPNGDIYNAVSGNVIFVENGEHVQFQGDYHGDPHPRTAVALSEQEDVLILVVVDGRQPNYSEGMTMKELAEVVIEYGGYTALNLDGGGSSTLVIEGGDGKADVLNSPIDGRIPGRERPVANHLGIYIDN